MSEDAYAEHRRRLRSENGLPPLDDDGVKIIDLPDNRGFIASNGWFWIDDGDTAPRRGTSSTGLPVWNPEEPW